MSEPQYKRKRNNYYMQKKRKQYILQPGLKGFLCTCNFREKECVREAYNILNLYADQLIVASEDKKITIEEKSKTAELDSDSDDIVDELSKEIDAYQKEKPGNKRFQVVESGAKNVVFIRTTVDNPTEIVTTVIDDILRTKEQKTRFLLRLIPIEDTCKANMDDIKKTVTALAEKHFCEEPKTYAIAFNHRNNQSISRNDIIKGIAEIITATNSKSKVDLKNPELTIIVELIRGMCLLSIIPYYNKYKKYNLLQLSELQNVSCESNQTNVDDTSTAEMYYENDDN